MKRLLRALPCALLLASPVATMAEIVNLEGTDYEVTTISDREIGPGIRHTRFRLPSYPLNINVLRVDLNNPYNRIETTVANESAKGTELLVHAAERQSRPGHRALAGANANFWVVASQPEQNTYTGTTRNASVRNGMIVTESNQHRDQWDGGTMRTGVVSMSTDKTAYIDYCTSYIRVRSAKFSDMEVHQVNKGIHSDELAMYNSFYGASRAFMPIYIDGRGQYQHDEAGDATEVILDLAEGSTWGSNRDIVLTVREVRLNGGKGTLGTHALALVGRGAHAAELAKLEPGENVTLGYGWVYNPNSDNAVNPEVEQAVGPNALIMRGGELTAHNSNETYNSQVYSRTGYGCSADGKMLYIVVIDKATDPVYGASSGCNTAKMCEFARWLGCSYMANFDAGGSAEMLVNGRIENRTTEGTPRAVANGWLVYSIAPEDTEEATTVARLEFDDVELLSPIYASYTPRVVAYNSYGAVIDDNFTDFTLSCTEGIGTCTGNTFYAGGNAATGTLTATYGSVSVEKPIEIKGSQMSIRIKELLIDGVREYPVEVESFIGDTRYVYDPSSLTWTVADPSVVSIDANGVLRAVAEGNTTFSCRIGDFEDEAHVTVEIASAAELGQDDWTDWTLKKSTGISKESMSADGHIAFTYDAPRAPTITVTKDVCFYSIPEKVLLEFTPSVAIENLTVDFRSALHTKLNNITVSPADGSANFAAGVKHTVEFPVSALGNIADLALYPLSVQSIRFNIVRDSANKGEQSIDLGRLYATYANYSGAGVDNIAVSRGIFVTPNPVAAGSTFAVRANDISSVRVFTTAGVCVHHVEAPADTDALTVTAPAAAGAYIVRVDSAEGSISTILIVK